MASLNFNAMPYHLAKGNIDFESDTFKMMLVTASYTPDKDAHDYKNDVTNEVTGTGYTAGGAVVTCTVAQDNTNDRVSLTWSDPTWPSATITARGAVIYKSRGGAASADELVCYLDFGADVSSTADTFTVDVSTPTYINN